MLLQMALFCSFFMAEYKTLLSPLEINVFSTLENQASLSVFQQPVLYF